MTENRWHDIWQGKGSELPEGDNPGLTDLIRADGFDSGAGDHTIESWTGFAQSVYRRLGLGNDDRVLEVGCGSGAFLYLARDLCKELAGVDYSGSLVALAQRAMPEGRFRQAEAAELPFAEAEFDLVLSHSVFQYFPSDDYARRSIEEMLRVLEPEAGRLAILDVNDIDREEVFYRERQAQLGDEDYETRYDGLPHRFYSKQWFHEILEPLGFTVETVDQAIAGYGNSAFRFNVFATRTP